MDSAKGMHLGRIRIAHKLLFMSLSFSLPMAVLLSYYIRKGPNADIEFAAAEMRGNVFQRPLEDLMAHITQHDLLTRRVLAGEGQLKGALAGAQARIDTAFQSLE